MDVIPICFDSFSLRSMATLVKTDSIRIFIDPSIAIAPRRYGLPPHPLELELFELDKEKIKRIAKKSDIFIITHYHWDHCPRGELLEILYDKKIFLKNIEEFINNSQRRRGNYVVREIVKKGAEVTFADGESFREKGVKIEFSDPVPHGKEKSKLGFLLMVLLRKSRKRILFASDIQGVISNRVKQEIIELNPQILILSGFPTYLIGYKFSIEEFEASKRNLLEIIQKTRVKTIILDHHTLRDANWSEFYSDIIEIGRREYNVDIVTAARYLGVEETAIESKREILWKSNVSV